MLKPQVLHLIPALPPLNQPLFHSSLPLISSLSNKTSGKNKNVAKKRGFHAGNIKAIANVISDQNIITLKAVVTVRSTISGSLSDIGFARASDDIRDLFGKSLLLELVSTKLDQKTGLEKGTISGYAHRTIGKDNILHYEAEFEVPAEFGEIGAVVVENEHHKEMFLHNIVLDGLLHGPVEVSCESWVHSKFDNPQRRVFFTNKPYLPSKTPDGLKRLRKEELEILRGNGQGERKSYERIYDYDVYNDLGDPDNDPTTKRPVLGGKDFKYPRRCRTGRPRCKTDPQSETRSNSVYVPRDEAFSEVKQLTFSAKTVYSVVHALVLIPIVFGIPRD